MASSHRRKKVLVIDGGGFRALGSLLIIDAVMKAAVGRASEPLLPCDVFDMISGTSAGGIVAILLGRLGLDCGTAIKIYKDLTKAICGDKEDVFWKNFLESMDTGLDSKKFEDLLEDIVKGYSGSPKTLMATSADGSNIKAYRSTKTFVTVTSEAPTYNNRVHCIRSYPSSQRVSPPHHQWLIKEALRGTVASRFFMSPLLISEYGFCDAGFAGYNNPVNLALEESDKLWPGEPLGLLVSLGNGLSSLGLPIQQRGWVVTDEFAKLLAEEMIAKTSSPSDEIRQYALNVVKHFAILAMDTKVAEAEVAAKYRERGIYIRLDPPLSIPDTDLVDFFNYEAVEAAVQQWLKADGQELISTVASELVELVLTPETARTKTPPPPPSSTNPGYNPQLDEKRPETMIDYLKKYHVFFVIDDSGSMRGSRWSETCEALIGIAEYALEQNINEIDMRFLNSPLIYRGVKGGQEIRDIFKRVSPGAYTPTGAILEKVLREHITKLDQALNTPEYGTLKPLDIILLTDGKPTDDPKTVLVAAAARMKKAKHHPNAIGVQIVQIGNESGAGEALKELMFGDIGNMVDTVPYDGILTPQRLERILLGGLHPNIRALLTINKVSG